MAKPRLESARTYFDEAESYENFGRAFITVVSGIMLAIGSMFVAFGESVTNFIVTIFDAFGIGATEWIFAFTRDPANFIGAAFASGAEAMLSAPWAELGPFLPILAALVSIAVVAIVTWYLDRRDSDVPGTGLNVPFIGNDEDGDPEDET